MRIICEDAAKDFYRRLSSWYQKEKHRPAAKYYVKGSHPAIISPEICDEVQEEIFRRAILIVGENGNRARENRVEMWCENGKRKGLLRAFSNLSGSVGKGYSWRESM